MPEKWQAKLDLNCNSPDKRKLWWYHDRLRPQAQEMNGNDMNDLHNWGYNMIKHDQTRSNNELLVTPGEVHQTWWTTKHLPSGRRLQFAMNKSIVFLINQLFQWAIFNSYVSHYQRVHGHRSSNHDCKRENRHKNKLGNWTWQEDNGEGEVAFKSWTATWSSRLYRTNEQVSLSTMEFKSISMKKRRQSGGVDFPSPDDANPGLTPQYMYIYIYTYIHTCVYIYIYVICIYTYICIYVM